MSQFNFYIGPLYIEAAPGPEIRQVTVQYGDSQGLTPIILTSGTPCETTMRDSNKYVEFDGTITAKYFADTNMYTLTFTGTLKETTITVPLNLLEFSNLDLSKTTYPSAISSYSCKYPTSTGTLTMSVDVVSPATGSNATEGIEFTISETGSTQSNDSIVLGSGSSSQTTGSGHDPDFSGKVSVSPPLTACIDGTLTYLNGSSVGLQVRLDLSSVPPDKSSIII